MLRSPLAPRTSVFAIPPLPSFALSAQELNDLIQPEPHRNFATAIVLTDSDVFTVGFHDFDPTDWLNLHNELSWEVPIQSICAKQLVYQRPPLSSTAPYEDPDSQIKHSLQGRLSAPRH
ncbi:Solitary outer membrane autotransporter beta-barrel domain [Vibrio vulnificus]|uniref:Solitary outer membrane autotransporter beta-barrel domain n=1 Tax=Vibrio vulnificus TaxID=672 RepID=UPI001EEADD6D|nr:Solitary outer membrane autotransporter beta-barrel domain [Vibrio vulnificus]MCG6295837.1 Solitary outer membrane autotransporter beta-barrel domain [Vibrio vulnificus]